MKILYIAPVGNYVSKDAGYGNSSIGILKVLQRMLKEKHIDKLSVIDTTSIGSQILDNDMYDVAILVTHPNSLLKENIKEAIYSFLSKAKKKYFSILWETDPLPEAWNWLWQEEVFDGFLAPSHFIEDLLKKVTSKPVYYYSYFININDYKKIDIDYKLTYENFFTVLYLGQYTKRKGIDETLISFIRALGEFPDCRLIIKYFELGSREIPMEQLIKYFVNTNIGKQEAPIYTLNQELSLDELNELYLNSSLLLAPSRGEGFGLTACEASCIGIPIIYSAWSGFLETAEGKGNIPIDCRIDCACCMTHHGYEIGTKYAYPSISELIQALRDKYFLWKNNRREYYEETKDNHKLVDSKYGYVNCKNNLLKIFNS